VANPDRLSGVDASFLHLEDDGVHMHVGSVLVFEGPAPAYDELIARLRARLHLVPRYRQKLAYPPLVQSRPVWVDDPHFHLSYHVRHTALPAPGGEAELKRLAGRVLAQRLDRGKPLWELWLVDRVGEDRFALVGKSHHSLVDGISGADLVSVLFESSTRPPEPERPLPEWTPGPEPSGAALLADAMAERAGLPVAAARAVGCALARPDRAAGRLLGAIAGLGSMAAAGLDTAPPSPLNVPIGPHRRYDWVQADLDEFRAIKTALGGTVNDVVLTVVAGALRAHWLAHDRPVGGVELRAMVPVSVRADAERGALGNRVSMVWAPLPLHAADPLERFRIVHGAMAGLKESGQAVGAEVLTRLTGFAPPTVLQQAARLQTRQRLFNLTVTNVPGPQEPLYLLGRRMLAFHPQVPLAGNTALGIAVMSYAGTIDFGLLSDYDALPDLEALAADLDAAIARLAVAAGVRRRVPRPVTAA
jgi:diacylglycerol O-acyltransferase / wax synthase